jgi:hypothetical protein
VGNVNVNAPGGDPAVVRKATALGILDAIEKGGEVFTKFRKLSTQAVS